MHYYIFYFIIFRIFKKLFSFALILLNHQSKEQFFILGYDSVQRNCNLGLGAIFFRTKYMIARFPYFCMLFSLRLAFICTFPLSMPAATIYHSVYSSYSITTFNNYTYIKNIPIFLPLQYSLFTNLHILIPKNHFLQYTIKKD